MSTKKSMKGRMYNVAALSILLLTALIMPTTVAAFRLIQDDVNAVTTNVGTAKVTGCGACHVAAGGGGPRRDGIDSAYAAGINRLATLLRPKKPPILPVTCDLPLKSVNGVCALTSVSCNEAAKEHESEHKDDVDDENDDGENEDDKNEDDKNDDDKGKAATGLVISNPGNRSIRAEQVLRLGVAASGDKRKITVGANLPKGAGFKASYNKTLQAQQGLINWKVPVSLSGKVVKIKFCAKVHNGKGYKKQDSLFVWRDVVVKVLPKLK
ncbi:hypothetical protein CRENPOLYSF2_3250001 [Crenothrix polyspora]|uniref:Uncharacterized protein n=1 Tax=Crenothrix polyspora TaxID=360316 RepID=A0A1R4HAN8_9GAMM|nr:hypothetical protein [Crenothrix polyspora]SJM93328.1 hypothetical protein CRENPOLYSF2_3250001 [Crenothrix polyspora]